MNTTSDLYEEDWYAWTQRQAALLRSWPSELRPNALDVEHIAEEIATMGKELRRQIEGGLEEVLKQLLKLEFHPDGQARRELMHSVNIHRRSLDRRFGPDDSLSLYAQRGALYARAWPRALRAVREDMALEGSTPLRPLPGVGENPRYNLDDEVLASSWYPPALAADAP